MVAGWLTSSSADFDLITEAVCSGDDGVLGRQNLGKAVGTGAVRDGAEADCRSPYRVMMILAPGTECSGGVFDCSAE